MSQTMEGKVAVVTGASRGIGKAIAVKLASKGATVVINYNGSRERAEEVKNEVESAGGKAVIIQCNVADFDACKEFIETVIKEQGRIDILVNNAGITKDGLLMKMSEEDFDKVLDTNLKGTFHTIRAALRQMIRQRSGRIINMASVVGVSGNAGQANYAASKAGVIGLTKTAAREVASRGITVNAVAPGFIETDMTEVLPEKIKEVSAAQIPLGKFGKCRRCGECGCISCVRGCGIYYWTGIACRRRYGDVKEIKIYEEKSCSDRTWSSDSDRKYGRGVLERHQRRKSGNRRDYQIRHHRI